jgi:hypothetical protein
VHHVLLNARATALALAIILASGSALADRSKAAVAYKEGTAAFARGAFAEAAAAFESAFAEDPRGASVYNAALAWQSAHADARAADDFERAVAAGDLRPDLLDNAKTQLAKLEPTLGRVSITGPAGAHYSVAHASGAPPASVHLAPGHYAVHATYDAGASAELSVDVTPGVAGHVDLPPPQAATPAETVIPAPVAVEPTRSSGVLGPTTLPIAIGLLGAGVVAGGFSVGFGVEAKSALNEFTQSGDTSQSAHDRAVSNRNLSNAMLIGALVVGGTGIAALVTVRRVKVQAAVGPGSLLLQGTF